MSAGMSVPGHGLGNPRNGLPEPAGYVYRGTGRDELTPPGVMIAWGRRLAAAGASRRPTSKADAARRREVENQLAAGAAIPQASPPARPAPSPAPRQLAGPEQEPVPYWPAYYPGPGVPGRCPDCGYMRTAPGHKVTCGGGS